jgi:Kef-type K+ transport system membrane component KefB
MSYAMKNRKNVVVSIVGLLVLATVSIWQFYLFATASKSGESAHLWWAIAAAIAAFGVAFLVFSVFVRHDTDDELHITAPPRVSAAKAQR